MAEQSRADTGQVHGREFEVPGSGADEFGALVGQDLADLPDGILDLALGAFRTITLNPAVGALSHGQGALPLEPRQRTGPLETLT